MDELKRYNVHSVVIIINIIISIYNERIIAKNEALKKYTVKIIWDNNIERYIYLKRSLQYASGWINTNKLSLFAVQTGQHVQWFQAGSWGQDRGKLTCVCFIFTRAVMWRKKLYSTYLIFFCSYISQIKEESGFRYFIFRLTRLLKVNIIWKLVVWLL